MLPEVSDCAARAFMELVDGPWAFISDYAYAIPPRGQGLGCPDLIQALIAKTRMLVLIVLSEIELLLDECNGSQSFRLYSQIHAGPGSQILFLRKRLSRCTESRAARPW